MADINSILSLIVGGLSGTLSECGFSAVIPEGVAKGELPAVTHGGKVTVEFAGAGKALRLEHFDNRLALLAAVKDGEITDGDYSQLTLSLLDASSADDKDVKYIVNEFTDTINERFSSGASKAVKTKLPPPVSKAAAKSGAMAYDANTLANRLTTIYSELRGEYKANCERYGDFLAEDFFVNYGTPAIIATIKKNDKQEMKRLFNLLNEIYDDGTNDIQSLIAVTILGALDNNSELLANCVDYMSADLCPTVIQVNKYLASGSGKSAKLRLENPPKYKPKKQKKSFIGSSLGM